MDNKTGPPTRVCCAKPHHHGGWTIVHNELLVGDDRDIARVEKVQRTVDALACEGYTLVFLNALNEEVISHRTVRRDSPG